MSESNLKVFQEILNKSAFAVITKFQRKENLSGNSNDSKYKLLTQLFKSLGKSQDVISTNIEALVKVLQHSAVDRRWEALHDLGSLKSFLNQMTFYKFSQNEKDMLQKILDLCFLLKKGASFPSDYKKGIIVADKDIALIAEEFFFNYLVKRDNHNQAETVFQTILEEAEKLGLRARKETYLLASGEHFPDACIFFKDEQEFVTVGPTVTKTMHELGLAGEVSPEKLSVFILPFI